MLTGFQALLDQAEKFLDASDPGPVRLAVLPGIDLAANVGTFKRQRIARGNAFIVLEEGRVVIRRDVLAAAGLSADPQPDSQLTVGGKPYRIETVTPDATSFALDCVTPY